MVKVWRETLSHVCLTLLLESCPILVTLLVILFLLIVSHLTPEFAHLNNDVHHTHLRVLSSKNHFVLLHEIAVGSSVFSRLAIILVTWLSAPCSCSILLRSVISLVLGNITITLLLKTNLLLLFKRKNSPCSCCCFGIRVILRKYLISCYRGSGRCNTRKIFWPQTILLLNLFSINPIWWIKKLLHRW